MKKLSASLLLLTVMLISALACAAEPVDTLAAVQKKGVLVAGVKNMLPPFGYVDEKSQAIVGYDIDFVTALAKKLGVKLELKPVTSEDRFTLLQNGEIDIIAATMSRTAEREKQIDFSCSYFFATQKLLVKKGTIKTIKDLAGKKVATVTGSTSEAGLRKAASDAQVVLFEKYPEAFKALQDGQVDAMTTDEPILAGLLSKAADKQKYEIPRLQIELEKYALGIRKGDKGFTDFVNMIMVEMEKSGEAKKIFVKWFGPKTDFPLNRNFKIAAGM
jgi:polar amino acid transport system substrate-binding protein